MQKNVCICMIWLAFAYGLCNIRQEHGGPYTASRLSLHGESQRVFTFNVSSCYRCCCLFLLWLSYPYPLTQPEIKVSNRQADYIGLLTHWGAFVWHRVELEDACNCLEIPGYNGDKTVSTKGKGKKLAQLLKPKQRLKLKLYRLTLKFR